MVGNQQQIIKVYQKSETATDTILGSASIEVGVTQTYTIEFIYKNNEDVDQSADMNKKLSGTIFIKEKKEKSTNFV